MLVRHHIKESENYKFDMDQPRVVGSSFVTKTHWDQVPGYEGNVVPVVFIPLVLVEYGGPRLI